MSVRIINADVFAGLAHLENESVNCCVTSPPYWGLRDYGVEGQIGIEPTPEAFIEKMVAVFRDVKRVLRKDGTLWLNIGDSYAGSGKGPSNNSTMDRPYRGMSNIAAAPNRWLSVPSGIKSKDLVGIPWTLAKALRDPYYAGKIKAERDRAWLAAMIDGEGTICGFHHIRKDDGRPRTGVNIVITNSHTGLLAEAHRIWPASQSLHIAASESRFGTKATYRWLVHGNANRLLFLREVYPYLIAKKQQALVAYNLLLLVADAKRLGHTPQRDAIREKRKFLTDLISSLNQQEAVDLPTWLVEPPSVLEPGWWLRQEIIWNKPNPMPESVRDRCTKSHEHIFLLTKSERYHFDAAAIAEAGSGTQERPQQRRARELAAEHGLTDEHLEALRACGVSDAGKAKVTQSGYGKNTAEVQRLAAEAKTALGGYTREFLMGETRNKRSVWTVSTTPYSDAHFATFPEEIPELCIKAGSRIGDTILDPFGGAGTTGLVADKLGRNAVLIELNPEYAAMAEKRIRGSAPLFAELEAVALKTPEQMSLV